MWEMDVIHEYSWIGLSKLLLATALYVNQCRAAADIAAASDTVRSQSARSAKNKTNGDSVPWQHASVLASLRTLRLFSSAQPIGSRVQQRSCGRTTVCTYVHKALRHPASLLQSESLHLASYRTSGNSLQVGRRLTSGRNALEGTHLWRYQIWDVGEDFTIHVHNCAPALAPRRSLGR